MREEKRGPIEIPAERAKMAPRRKGNTLKAIRRRQFAYIVHCLKYGYPKDPCQKEYYRGLTRKEHFIAAGLPPELVDIKLPNNWDSSYRAFFRRIMRIYDLIESGLSSIKIAKKTGYADSMIRRIRLGIKWKKHRLIYDKYKKPNKRKSHVVKAIFE